MKINFEKGGGLVPCIVQDAETQKVLMLGYLNQEALDKTIDSKQMTFFSRTKNKLWTKGETSGNYLNLVDITHDCDNDTLLAKVNPVGPVCHMGTDTCFNEANTNLSLSFLETIIHERKQNPVQGSYTNKLLSEGINRVAQKVGEEAVELVIESKDDNKEKFLGEAADLMYHFLVLLACKDTSLRDVIQVLEQRHVKKSS